MREYTIGLNFREQSKSIKCSHQPPQHQLILPPLFIFTLRPFKPTKQPPPPLTPSPPQPSVRVYLGRGWRAWSKGGTFLPRSHHHAPSTLPPRCSPPPVPPLGCEVGWSKWWKWWNANSYLSHIRFCSTHSTAS